MQSMPYAASESLAAAFAEVPDPRRQASVRYPLSAVLSLAVSALLAGQHSVLAIAEWAARQPAEVLVRLGFGSGQTPCQSTLQRLFVRLDVDALTHTLTAHFAPAAADTASPVGGQSGRQSAPGPTSVPRHGHADRCVDGGLPRDRDGPGT